MQKSDNREARKGRIEKNSNMFAIHIKSPVRRCVNHLAKIYRPMNVDSKYISSNKQVSVLGVNTKI